MKKLTLILAAIVAAYTTPTAFAQSDSDNGFYVGGGGGIGKLRDSCSDEQAVRSGVTLTLDKDSCDDGSTAWRAFVGYQFNPYLGAELEYVFSNGYEADVIRTEAGTQPTRIGVDLDFQTLGISAVARYPFNDSFSVFGRGGVHFWEVEGSVSGRTNTDDGTDLLLGGGIEFRPTDKIGVRLEHARYFADDDDLDATTLQLVLYL